MLDSGQFLEHICIENCFNPIKEYDTICLEENTFDARSKIQKMYETYRKLIHENADLSAKSNIWSIGSYIMFANKSLYLSLKILGLN
jgi:hypothetical protein